MESSLDWAINSGDFWDHGMSSETSYPMDLENAVLDDANQFEQTSYNECNPLSTDNGKEATQPHANRRNTAPPPPSHRTMNLISTEPCQLSEPGGVLNFPNNQNEDTSVNTDDKPRCWDHGCNGREFSSKSNFVRHKKEKEGEAAKAVCPLCGGTFSRSSARDTHLAKQSCNRIRRYSNGRPRPSKIALLSSLNFAQSTH